MRRARRPRCVNDSTTGRHPRRGAEEFKKVELPASTINIQPPNGETLVNFKTILSTQAERHQVTVRLNQVNIDLVLEIWPSHFLWKHGDGTTQESTNAGLMWTEGADVDSDGFVTHVYTQALKAAQVSVDTTWSAQFKVVGAPDWRPVNGTVTKVGEPRRAHGSRGHTRARHRPGLRAPGWGGGRSRDFAPQLRDLPPLLTRTRARPIASTTGGGRHRNQRSGCRPPPVPASPSPNRSVDGAEVHRRRERDGRWFRYDAVAPNAGSDLPFADVRCG